MRDVQDPLHALLDLLRQHAPELLPICRYLMLGPFLADSVVSEHTRAPTVRELIALKRVCERHGADLRPTLDRLIEASGQSPAVRLEIEIDRLLEVDPALWTHPVHVLESPRSSPADLLEACRLRLETAGRKQRARLEAVREKLRQAMEIDDRARERREQQDPS